MTRMAQAAHSGTAHLLVGGDAARLLEMLAVGSGIGVGLALERLRHRAVGC